MAGADEGPQSVQPVAVTTKPVFIILGKPGCGKTTLAAKLASKLNAELVSPTHALENVLQEETDLSKEVTELTRQGKDVPTTLVVRAMENRLRAEETSFRGYVLEGVPSNLPSTGSSVSQDLQLLTRCATNSAKIHTPVLIDLRIDDANLTLRRQHQYLDPVTGVIYNGAHVEFSRKPPVEGDTDPVDSAADAGSVRDVAASVASLSDVEGNEDVGSLVWDATIDEEEFEEEKAEGEDEEVEETEHDVEQKRRSRLRKRRAATRKAIFSGKCLWTRIDAEILQRLIQRPEDSPKAVQRSLEEYNNHAPFLRTLVGTHFGALSKIVVDATQNADAVFLDVLQQIDQKEILHNKKNTLPKRIGGPEQAAGFKNLPADDIIKYLCEADLEPGLPRRELTLWGNFCPVSYFNGASLVAGQFNYPVSYKGKLYLLATEANFSAFLLNPDKYLAQPPRLNSLKMCMMGGPFSGKSTQAQKLAEAYQLKLVDVDAYLTKWDRDPDQQELQKKSPVYSKIIRKCKSGKIITGDLLVDVIKLILKDNSQNYNGWVLDGFPRTMEQAQQLAGAGIIPTYAVVLQNDINEQTVRDRGAVFQVDSATGYKPETNGRVGSAHSQNRNGSIQTIAELPFFDNLFNGFKEEYTEIVRVLEDVDVQVLPVPAEYHRMTITSMIHTAVDPFFQKARAVQANKMMDGIFEFGRTADYCPYTRKMRNILYKGSKQYTATYKSRIYYCASEEAKASFITEPHNYINQESGEPLKVPPVRLMFIGPVGAGKSSAISQPQIAKYGTPHVSFDEYLEAFRVKQSETVAAEIEYMIQENAGILSPPIVAELISTLFTKEPYASKGFILEGFPRSKMEGDIILKQGYHVDAFVNFKIDSVAVARRLQDLRNKSRSLEEIQGGEDDKFEDYLDACEKELSKIGDVLTSIETTSQIPLIEVEASRCTRAVVGVLVKRLQQFFEDRSSLLCKPVSLELNSAQAILANDARRNSKFGKYCPVEHFTNKALTSKLYGRLPVLWDGEIYFLRNEKNKQMFMSNVLRYLDQPAPLPVSRPSICIVGQPKAGKTYLGQTLAEDFNMEYLTVSKAVQTILGSQEELIIRQQLLDALGKGCELTDDICNQALHLIISRASCQSKGWVLDGYPLTVRQCELVREGGILPQKVANINLAENLVENRSRDDMAAASSLNIASLDIPEIIRLRDLKIKEQLEQITRYLQIHSSVMHPVDGSMSKWHLRTALSRSIFANIAERQVFIALTSKGRAASMAGMGVGLETLQQKTSELGRYCPVRLVDHEELVIGPLSTEFVAVYKDTYYWMAGRNELERFLNDEVRYTAGRKLPSPLPKQISANQFKELFPTPLEMQGYCVVTFVQGFEKGDGHVPLSNIVPGDHAFLAEYDSKVYAMASADQLDKFMRTPWKYVGYRLPKKLPPIHAPLNVAALPMVGYLEQSVAICLNSALSAVGKFRPKFPYRSLPSSGLHYVALHMKAHNPKSSEFIRKEYSKRLDRYQKQCHLIESLSKYAASAQYVAPERREPNFDKDMETFLSLNPGRNISEKKVGST